MITVERTTQRSLAGEREVSRHHAYCLGPSPQLRQ